jgi:hypothetical protein
MSQKNETFIDMNVCLRLHGGACRKTAANLGRWNGSSKFQNSKVNGEECLTHKKGGAKL